MVSNVGVGAGWAEISPHREGEEEGRCRKAGAEEGSEQVPLRGMKRRKPMITNGNKEAGIAAAPPQTQRDNTRAP